jgi:16S rRNA processing protein RimM
MTTLILLGRITDAHGIRGAVKLKSFTADPKSIATYGELQTADGRTITIARMKPTNDGFIADLKNITDRNAAETFKGQDLLVAREKMPAANDDEIYLVDLVGREVTVDGNLLGTISGIENYGAGDLLAIDTGAKESILVPAIFLKIIGDTATLDLPEGFLDLDVKKE